MRNFNFFLLELLFQELTSGGKKSIWYERLLTKLGLSHSPFLSPNQVKLWRRESDGEK